MDAGKIWAWNVACIEAWKESIHRILTGKPEGRPRCKRVDNIKMEFRDIG
jgi:hypothetical protein